MEDNEAVRRVKEGDTEAFSFLVEKYHRPLLSFIFRLTGCEDAVEDIGQEVFLSVYKSLKNFDETRGAPFSAWLFISARNRCIGEFRNAYRARKVGLDDLPELRDTSRSAEEVLLESERRQALEASLAQLTEPYKSTILNSLKGDSLEEIARRDNVPVGTVKSRLFRARERMRKLVSEYFGGKDYEGI